jgi:O-methyltransferase involved in polyketide biosynthesis
VGKVDASVPSIARVYDYVLGGKDNFASDRALAKQLLTLVPPIAELAVQNRRFLARAVTWAANQAIGQFIDLGCGLPTEPNTHESARAVIGDARVAYADNDPVVVNHLRALLANGNPGVSVVDGDVRDVAATLDGVRASLDLSAPACLVAGYLLHFFTADVARDMMAGYVAALAPGSCLVISVLHAAESEAADESLNTFSTRAVPVYSHPLADVASFFGPLELVPPGIVKARQWRPGPAKPPPRDNYALVGVARKRGPATIRRSLAEASTRDPPAIHPRADAQGVPPSIACH